MSAYTSVRGGKLKLKGKGSSLRRKRKHKQSREDSEQWAEGSRRHGSWRKSCSAQDVTDQALFELHTGGYIAALDTGHFTASAPVDVHQAPEPEQVLTVVQVSETKVALKSAFGRYMSVASSGELSGRAEAIGPRETWELVFEEGHAALCACNHRFVTLTSEGHLLAASERVREHETLTMWCDAAVTKKAKTESEIEEDWTAKDMETNYVKRFQSFTDHKLRISGESKSALLTAKTTGKLHEALLDRREKMKADRYCK